MEVVRLGASADYETEDQHRERLRRSPLLPADVAEAFEAFRRQYSVTIEEFARPAAAEHAHDSWHIAARLRELGVDASPEGSCACPTTSSSATGCDHG